VTQPDDRHRALLRILARHEVRFVLVGGVALQLRGFSGATRDVDVTIAADAANRARLAVALEALRARPYLAGERGSAYHTDLGQLEVMQWTDGVGDYDAWTHHATTFDIEPGLPIQVGATSDLLLAKETSGRTKDLDALPRIRAELLAAGTLAPTEVRGPVAEFAHDVEPDPRMEELLGPRPPAGRARGLWDHAAELIIDYRNRWNLPDHGSLLADPPRNDRDQAADRQALDRQLARLHRLITRAREPPSIER
jgi:hypothetical protein